MAGHDIIVVGASAGGVEALVNLVGSLPADLPAAIFIVLHIPAQCPSVLPDILTRSGPLVAFHAEDGDAIEPGKIYVAPPDHHLLIADGSVQITYGPKENRHRPAIDPLFRSAATTYKQRVTGVVLTGALDDGTAGLLAIKQCGGLAVVQNPKDASYPSMPLNAIEHVKVDYVLPLQEIGALLVRLAHEAVQELEEDSTSEDMDIETRMAKFEMKTIHDYHKVGTPSAFSCPDCGGVLWEIHDGDLLRFRCRVGHAFSVESMFSGQADEIEAALWAAMKTLEESASLARRMMKQAKDRGQDWLARSFEERLAEAERHSTLIGQVLRRDQVMSANGSMLSRPEKIHQDMSEAGS